jgi:restriction system protein
MTRRTSVFTDLIDITARLPAWVGVGLALVAYLVCHVFSTGSPVQATGGPGAVAAVAQRQLIITISTLLQYVLPMVFLAGALASFVRRHKRSQVFAGVSSGSPITIQGLTWREFEMLIGEGFRRRGYAVTETGGAGADGGVDLVLTKGGKRYFVQCKQWKALKVGVRTVRELYGVIAARGAAGGFLVTSGTFTDEAQRFAEDQQLQLIGGDALSAWLGKRIEPEMGGA